MASTFRLFRNLKSKFRSISGSVIYPNARNILRIPTSILFMSSAISFKDGKESDGLQAADMESLTTSTLLKNASLECINSASALLTHTASNLIDLERHYTQALHTLRRLFEISLGDLDDESRQLAFWDAVMEIRHEIARLKKERNDMESMFFSAERMLHAAAESALVAGANYASTVAGERIFSAQCQLRALQQARIETEAIVGQSEAEYIHAFSEHKKNKKAEQQQAEIEEEFEDKREAYFDDNYENNEKSFEDTRDAYFDDNYVKSHEIKVKAVVTDDNDVDNLPQDIPFGLTEETFKEEDNFGSRND